MSLRQTTAPCCAAAAEAGGWDELAPDRTLPLEVENAMLEKHTAGG